MGGVWHQLHMCMHSKEIISVRVWVHLRLRGSPSNFAMHYVATQVGSRMQDEILCAIVSLFVDPGYIHVVIIGLTSHHVLWVHI